MSRKKSMKLSVGGLDVMGHELNYSPARVRRSVIRKIERLVPRLDPEADYPLDYILNEVTGFVSENGRGESAYRGEDLQADLVEIALRLSEGLEIKAESIREEVLSIHEAAGFFNVATKTVYRWMRGKGLVGYKMVLPDGKKKLAFRRSVLDEFAAINKIVVMAGGHFSKIGPAERMEILERAMWYHAHTKVGFTEITKLVAKEFGRSAEAMRQVVKKHDQDPDHTPIFPTDHVEIDERARREMTALFEGGKSLADLAKRYKRSRSAIHRIIYKQKAENLLARNLRCVTNPVFETRGAERKILGEGDLLPDLRTKGANPLRKLTNVQPYFKDLYAARILTREEERDLFRKYNFLKFKAIELREKVTLKRPSAKLINRIEGYLKRASEVKKAIVQANLRLVVSIAKRHVGPRSDLATLVSDGNYSLIKAVETFDYARGNRFSTYASWAIMKNFARTIPEENYRLRVFHSAEPELLEEAGQTMAETTSKYEDLVGVRAALEQVMGQLTPRERTVLEERFGLGEDESPKTLEQIGSVFSLSKERIRQIEAKALEKMRDIIEDEQLELSAP